MLSCTLHSGTERALGEPLILQAQDISAPIFRRCLPHLFPSLSVGHFANLQNAPARKSKEMSSETHNLEGMGHKTVSTLVVVIVVVVVVVVVVVAVIVALIKTGKYISLLQLSYMVSVPGKAIYNLLICHKS